MPEPRWRIRVPGVEQRIGFGDAVKKATSALGVAPCKGCRKRADRLNRLLVIEGTTRPKKRGST